MDSDINPALTDHLPSFVSGPGGPDWLLVVTSVFLVVILLVVGTLYLKLHSVPERMAHRGKKLQFEIVAVLGLIALFTHNHAFWIAGLLLAFVSFPDFNGLLVRMTRALETIAGIAPPAPEDEGLPAAGEPRPREVGEVSGAETTAARAAEAATGKSAAGAASVRGMSASGRAAEETPVRPPSDAARPVEG